MAAKENQGLQAIVITLTILLLLTGVGLLLVNNNRKTLAAQVADLQRQNSDYQSGAAKAQAEANEYKSWIGFEEAALLETLTPMFEEDQKRYGAGIEEASRQYKTMLENTFEERRKTEQNESSALQQVKELKERLLAVEAQKEVQVKQFQSQLEQAKNDFAKEQKTFDELKAKTLAEKEEISKKLAELQTAHDESVAKLEGEKNALEVNIGKLERSIQKLREGVPNPDQFAQPADGRIARVSQPERKAWINLGSADGLRPQVTFSVVGDGNADAEAAAKKGSIEVMRILGPHMAEAQITSDEATNPIMPGDRIFSQVWDRGRQVSFGIAGFIDLDKDGRSDLQQLKGIIAANNGRVAAAPDETGKLQGELQVDTRYLILGTRPEGTLPTDDDLRASWDVLSTQAEELGIEPIPLEEFVKLMGWRIDNRSVALDATSRAEDFPPRAREQEMPRKPVQPAGVFKKRLPAVSY